MRLNELTTPFERRRVIEYGVDGNKVVRHWYEVQHVTGTLYKSQNVENEWGDLDFTLFVFLPGVLDGLRLERMRHPNRYTVEQMADEIVRIEHDSLSSIINGFNKRMDKNEFIGNAQIEFVRQFDSERADIYAAYRADYYARKEEAARQAALVEQVREAEEEAARQAALEKEKASYLGWADEMTALRFGRVKAQMEKLVRFDGKVMSYRDFIIQTVKDGWMPNKQEGVTTWYGSRWERKQSKPKTVYRLSKGNLCYTISKTEFDFAEFLVSKSAL